MATFILLLAVILLIALGYFAYKAAKKVLSHESNDSEKTISPEKKLCPKCQAEIKAEAKKCPHCQSDLRSWINRHPFWTILLLLFFIGQYSVFDSLNNPSGSNSFQGSEWALRSDQVWVISQSFVEAQLKSPSSAKFPARPAQIASEERNHWLLQGYVDSENGFGAMIRTTFFVELKFNGSSPYEWDEISKWELIDLNLY